MELANNDMPRSNFSAKVSTRRLQVLNVRRDERLISNKAAQARATNIGLFSPKDEHRRMKDKILRLDGQNDI